MYNQIQIVARLAHLLFLVLRIYHEIACWLSELAYDCQCCLRIVAGVCEFGPINLQLVVCSFRLEEERSKLLEKKNKLGRTNK